jgi:hypothetical protein
MQAKTKVGSKIRIVGHSSEKFCIKNNLINELAVITRVCGDEYRVKLNKNGSFYTLLRKEFIAITDKNIKCRLE